MKINDEEIKKLKKEVKSLEDLKTIASKNGINCAEEDLKDVYNQLQDGSLENVTGGLVPTEFFWAKCYRCRGPVKIYTDILFTYYCPKCGEPNYDGHYTRC